MNRKGIIGAVVGLLLLTGIIGANLVMAGQHDTGRAVRSQEATTTTDGDHLDCPSQGLPACQGQMNDEKSEGSGNEATDQNEAADKNEAADGTEKEALGSENEANDQNEGAEGSEKSDSANGATP